VTPLASKLALKRFLCRLSCRGVTAACLYETFLQLSPRTPLVRKLAIKRVQRTPLYESLQYKGYQYYNLFLYSFLTRRAESEDAPCKQACNNKGPATPLVKSRQDRPFILNYLTKQKVAPFLTKNRGWLHEHIVVTANFLFQSSTSMSPRTPLVRKFAIKRVQ